MPEGARVGHVAVERQRQVGDKLAVEGAEVADLLAIGLIRAATSWGTKGPRARELVGQIGPRWRRQGVSDLGGRVLDRVIVDEGVVEQKEAGARNQDTGPHAADRGHVRKDLGVGQRDVSFDGKPTALNAKLCN